MQDVTPEPGAAAGTGALIKIAAEEHDGNFSLYSEQNFIFQGEWDKSFDKPERGDNALDGGAQGPAGSADVPESEDYALTIIRQAQSVWGGTGVHFYAFGIGPRAD